MSAEIRGAHRKEAQRLVQELTFGGHSWDGAESVMTQALADADAEGYKRGRVDGYGEGYNAGRREAEGLTP